ncbi:sodium-coupled monocarboxylate transporter 1-like [Mizuhopecten yessoensis]|uniref:Sodium-coupled monocarboxylate transporter 2 n=1 Tax=Mizuhopecten yessoensis TaxID=6573 RepID=A0A210QI59_MIZYE|nr:sodium-coupled monocarboxylate transporter 1-like [Mizuhopecten yessoensis]OWF48465.1 Sodium-coupled monocarboxylate transporter 2 [Mizuhopecten yessoensis]
MERTYQYNFETNKNVAFNEIDFIVFGATLLASASIGLYYAIRDRKSDDAEDFLLGGRKMHYLPVSLSLLSSFISAITLLGTPAEVYRYNTMYWWITVGFLITAMGAAHIFIPVFYNLKVVSTFKYAELRFGKVTRFSASIIYLVWMMLYMSIVLYGPSLALNAVTGLSLWGSVFAVGLVTIFYTTLGGMKAVVWSDSLQMLIMFAGMMTLLVAGSLKIGGLDKAWQVAERNGRTLLLEFDPDPSTRHTVWNVVIGGGIFWGAIYGINQAQVQRAISVSSMSNMRKAIWLNFPGMAIILTLVCLVGVVMFAYYERCDPVTLGIIKSSDQLIPLFTMDLLGSYHGLPGLVLSCVFSGSLSTISSGLNAVAAVLLEDFVRPFYPRHISGRASTIFSKVTIVVAGLCCIGLAFVVSKLGAILQVAYILFGILGGPLLGLFTLGMLFPWANKWGGLVGHLTALILLMFVGLGTKFNNVVITPPSPVTTSGCYLNATSALTTVAATVASTMTTTAVNQTPKEDPFILYRMSYMWYTSLAVLTTVVVGLLVSFATGATKPEELDPRLICAFFDEFCPWLPEKTRKRLRFGVRHGEEDVKPTDITKSGKVGMVNAAYFTDVDDVSKQRAASSTTLSDTVTKPSGTQSAEPNVMSNTNGVHKTLYPSTEIHSTNL